MPSAPPKLARTYKGAAKSSSARDADDPEAATHRYAGTSIRAWGRFEGPEPENKFRVLAGSDWRPPNLDPTQASYAHQLRVANRQDPLVNDGVLDEETMTFVKDHVFDNWSQAVGVVSGKGSYSGGYHWQPIDPSG